MAKFKKGQSGNPNGRPKGSKDRFREDFWRDLANAWEANGAEAFKRVIKDHPDRFIAVAAGLLPKEEKREIEIKGVRLWTEAEWLAYRTTHGSISESTTPEPSDTLSQFATEGRVKH